MMPVMLPAPGDRLQRFVGDRVLFELRDDSERGATPGWLARLRTNLGRGEGLRREIIQAHTAGLPLAGASWRDLPMPAIGEVGWSLELPLTEVGYFKAKAYLIDPQGWQHWPAGPDVGLSVHPARYRTGNTIYCAFARMFGPAPSAAAKPGEDRAPLIAALDQEGYTVIPPSGKLRDLTAQIPRIVRDLGCRILHLLPVNPTPTTGARFGRFGSPYAALDLTAIDPALVAFDRRTTGIDQFCELTYATHLHGGRVFLDIVINHTGWGSVLQENHPQWFLRQPDGQFASPGAWGVTWEDLVELKHEGVALWDELAGMFLTWCRRGVDGFRCDAGYKVPVAAWQYIVARVQQEYPETIFLLEGLGGAWEATEALLTEGGMQWAYSELFQNYSVREVADYLDHVFRQSGRSGLLVHYSETHDNDRLAKRGRAWSLLRNRLCALASVSGGFGFACGVEWLASERINVHSNPDLGGDSPDNLLPELTKLNQLVADHPCFFDGAVLSRLSPADSPAYALRRESEEGRDIVLILVNTDLEQSRTITLESDKISAANVVKIEPGPAEKIPKLPHWLDLLGQPTPDSEPIYPSQWKVTLPPGASYCLSPAAQPIGLHGEAYRRARLQSAWALTALSQSRPIESLGHLDWRALAAEVDLAPAGFLARIPRPGASTPEQPDHASNADPFPCVILWTLLDVRRITPVPPGHWLLIQDQAPFRAMLQFSDGSPVQIVESIPVCEGHVACFPPRTHGADAELSLERYAEKDQQVSAAIRYLDSDIIFPPFPIIPTDPDANSAWLARRVLLTNGRGGMARICLDLGRIESKYDCVLGANLHPNLPVDRHVFAKRIRVWLNADGFITPLDGRRLVSFMPGPPAVWNFAANAGDGRTVEIQLKARMPAGRNTTVFQFSRPSEADATGYQLPATADVRLIVRVDIEDRNFHWETKRNSGADHHFSSHTQPMNAPAGSPMEFCGFAFTPAPDRQLRVFSEHAAYHPQPEWCESIPHPIEQTRGQTVAGDAFSPGWFELPLPKGAGASLIVTAEWEEPETPDLSPAFLPPDELETAPIFPETDSFGRQLLRAARAFVARRGEGKTVVAGYPWFLDWGRDTFIAARGLITAGWLDEVQEIAVTFARFEKDGTLPNIIHGANASNRDTSDAPLWFGVVCEELAAARVAQAAAAGGAERGAVLAAAVRDEIYLAGLDASGRNLCEVLESIARNYQSGTTNGIRMDPASGLIWSPTHFTWMDTNYPACTPREGYPVEIQALWIRLLRHLGRVSEARNARAWNDLADRALASLESLFWRDKDGFYADVLLAPAGRPAAQAVADDALRSNCLFVVSLGLAQAERARRCVAAARRYLVVPGGLRSLAPLPVSVPLHNLASDGRPLNNPAEPYWGSYEGDEDTRRKPGYHNGTAWTWTFPVFCEALARAWDFTPAATSAARAYLGSSARTLAEGCIGQIPEILDGDAPHTPRGCDAQAWGVTEALRVWKLLQSKSVFH
jgi:glycogen debranching enzyme